MIRSLYTSVSGLVSLENKQTNIINNLNNVNTNGYKSDDLILRSFKDVMMVNKDNSTGNQIRQNRLGEISLGCAIDEVSTKYTQGLLKETGRTTDFAVDGRGFFVVDRMTAGGMERFYTRDGSFKVGNNGYLMTANGDYVVGVNKSTGNQEPVFVGTDKFVLDVDNSIYVNGVETYTLATADFQDYDSLKKVGDNLYRGENPVYNAEVWVHQGFVEQSNVSLSDQMTEMISTMRNFESNQKMVQMIDDTLGKAANEIGTVR